MENFYSIYDQGYARVAACTMPVALAQPALNAETIADMAVHCAADGVALAVFPELSLTGYSIDDLHLQDTLLDAAEEAIATLADQTKDLLPVIVVGAPLAKDNRVYNCAVVLHRGEILGVVPKSYIPNYREFYEARWFARGDDQWGEYISLGGVDVPFGPDLLFKATDLPGFVLNVEVCEDMWVPIPPSSNASLAGATILANISSSPITIGRASDRAMLSLSMSYRNLAAHVYAAAGEGESSTDLSWDGQTKIHELGAELASSERFGVGPQITSADIDLSRIRAERIRQGTFDDNRRTLGVDCTDYRTIPFDLEPPREDIGLQRKVDRFPFVPDDETQLAQDCYEAFNIQVYGLMQRCKAIGGPKIVIGVSGGLDSTHALMVAAQAMDRMGRPRTDILAFTMPGFATTAHTKSNAERLSESLGVTFAEIDIRPVAKQMLTDMGHPFGRGEEVYDVTFENVQAGLRTDYLFRIANDRGGIVLGTGDLSELALGWATYGVGDQMSHYNVNPGMPKTLMQHVLRWVISSAQFDDAVSATLQSILDTEITPELIPTKEGEVPQSTEASIGPYALQDFNLYGILRAGQRPSRIAFLAYHAWSDAESGLWPAGYPEESRRAFTIGEIKKWLHLFLKRFFANQFKRSALPNGPKVAAGGALSPRGDWRMPSDVSSALWLADLDNIPDA